MSDAIERAIREIDERRAFEKWAVNGMRDTELASAWAAWRASAERQAAEIAALRADAERYRWLRTRNDGSEADPPGPYAVEGFDGQAMELKSAQLDAAIDAGIAGEPPNSGKDEPCIHCGGRCVYR